MVFGKSLLLALVLMALVIGRAAYAGSISYNLTSDHCTGGCGPAGTIFGVVTLVENGANVDVTVDLNDPYWWAKTGSVDFQMFLFSGTGVVAGDISVNQTWAGQTLAASAGPYIGSGTGSYGFGIACTTCGNGLHPDAVSAPLLIFHVANAVNTDLTVPNALGNVFVADIGNTTTGLTGPIDATVPNQVPDGGMTISLLGMAMAGLGLAARRIKK